MKPLLVDKEIYRGPEPVSDDDWKSLVDLGIKDILDLETGARLLQDGDPLEQAIVADKLGIRVWSHPISELIFPKHEQLIAAVNFLVSRPTIYVHCKAGVDRTGMVCAMYRMKVNQWPKSQAIAEMHARGMHPWYYPWETVL